MVKRTVILLLAALLLTGCGKKGNEPAKDISEETNKISVEKNKEVTLIPPADTGKENKSGKKEEGYTFVYNKVTIHMNTDAATVIKTLGEPQDYFEAESCAFKGLDKIYYYSGIELSTYPKGNEDYISSVNLVDDSVSTPEGICLGLKLEEVLKAYGNSYKEDAGAYIYTSGDSQLTFVIENDAVTAITYLAVVEELK